MATFNRGRHILPSVQSVLGQAFQDFELLVVGDHCTDDTETALGPWLSHRLRWTNLAERGGSQSYPNNAGLRQARGRYIAYIGHDDVWAPDHLQALAACFEAAPNADFAVSGMIIHPSPAVPRVGVSGLFEASSEASVHFFPPSALSHRKDVIDRIGPWGDPRALRAPVDVDLQRRAVNANLLFRSTGAVTAHKFTAAARYLSYLAVTSDEQQNLLGRFNRPGFAEYVSGLVADARQSGGYMSMPLSDYASRKPGESFEINTKIRGVNEVPVESLSRPQLIRPVWRSYAGDWHDKPVDGHLWARANLTPKLLVPYVGTTTARLFVPFAAQASNLFRIGVAAPPIEQLRIHGPEQVGSLWRAVAQFDIPLHPDRATVLTFSLIREQLSDLPLTGLGVGSILVSPIGGPSVKADLGGLDGWLRERFSSLSVREGA